MTRSAGEVGALTTAPRRRGPAPRVVLRDEVRPHPATRGNAPFGSSVGRCEAPPSGTVAGTGRETAMGLFDRLRGGAGGRRGTLDRGAHRADLAHLERFVATRRGVEGYV